MNLNPKFVLAFFLIIVAALLVVFFILIVTNRPPGSAPLDAGTVAVIVGLITTFVLMAKTASDYQFASSSGSDKKDDNQAKVSAALAEKVPTPAPVTPTPVPPTVVVAWWGALDAAEQAALTAAAATDPKVQAFIDAAKTGKASAADLAYLVSKIPPLLSQARADAIAATNS